MSEREKVVDTKNSTQADGEQDSEFWQTYHSFWRMKKTNQIEQPKFYGQRLDLEVLFRTVKDMGGFEQVSIERKWAQVARIICSSKSTSNGSFMIKRIYERMLLDLEIELKNQQQSGHKRASQQRISGHIQKKNNIFIQRCIQENGNGQVEDVQLNFPPAVYQTNYEREMLQQQQQQQQYLHENYCRAFVTLLQNNSLEQDQLEKINCCNQLSDISPLFHELNKINQERNMQNQMTLECSQGSSQSDKTQEPDDFHTYDPSEILLQVLLHKMQELEDFNAGLKGQLEKLQIRFSQLEERLQNMQEVEEKQLSSISQILQYNQNIINVFL